MDQTLADYESAYYEHKNRHPHINYPQSVPGFFTALTPIEGAISTFQWLMSQNLFEVIFLQPRQ